MPPGVNLAGSRDKTSAGGDQRRLCDKAEHCEVHTLPFTGAAVISCVMSHRPHKGGHLHHNRCCILWMDGNTQEAGGQFRIFHAGEPQAHP